METVTGIVPRAGIEVDTGDGETHVQSARRYSSIVNVQGIPARPLPERLSSRRTTRPSRRVVAGSRTLTSRTFAWCAVFEIVFSSFGNSVGAGYGPNGNPPQFEAVTAHSIAKRLYEELIWNAVPWFQTRRAEGVAAGNLTRGRPPPPPGVGAPNPRVAERQPLALATAAA